MPGRQRARPAGRSDRCSGPLRKAVGRHRSSPARAARMRALDPAVGATGRPAACPHVLGHRWCAFVARRSPNASSRARGCCCASTGPRGSIPVARLRPSGGTRAYESEWSNHEHRDLAAPRSDYAEALPVRSCSAKVTLSFQTVSRYSVNVPPSFRPTPAIFALRPALMPKSSVYLTSRVNDRSPLSSRALATSCQRGSDRNQMRSFGICAGMVGDNCIVVFAPEFCFLRGLDTSIDFYAGLSGQRAREIHAGRTIESFDILNRNLGRPKASQKTKGLGDLSLEQNAMEAGDRVVVAGSPGSPT